jgi:uncharacterized Zn-binding protein involved in type VI secretion
MPAISRKDDLSTGHGCYSPTPMMVTPVKKTFFNDKLAGVLSEECQFESHTCGIVTHTQVERFVSSGASKTFIEGILAARIGDDIACGDAIAEGSENTFIE